MSTDRGRTRSHRRWRFAVAASALVLGVALPELAAEQPASPPAAQIQGRLYLRRNEPVPGVTVMLRPQAGGSPIFVTASDAKGVFRLRNLPDGVYRGELRRDGLKPVVRENYSLKAPFRAVYEVQLAPEEAGAASPSPAPSASPAGASGRASLRGTVQDRDGGPLVEARITLTRQDGSADPRSTFSGKDGTFSVTDFPAGRWDLEVEGPGLLPIRVPLDLSGDENLVATLVQQPATYAATPEDLMPEEESFPPK